MFLQFFTKRRFIFAESFVLSAGRGVDQNPKTKAYSVGNRGVIELKNDEAKKILKRYGKECEPWGKDAVMKTPPKRGKNSVSHRAPENTL